MNIRVQRGMNATVGGDEEISGVSMYRFCSVLLPAYTPLFWPTFEFRTERLVGLDMSTLAVDSYIYDSGRFQHRSVQQYCRTCPQQSAETLILHSLEEWARSSRLYIRTAMAAKLSYSL